MSACSPSFRHQGAAARTAIRRTVSLPHVLFSVMLMGPVLPAGPGHAGERSQVPTETGSAPPGGVGAAAGDGGDYFCLRGGLERSRRIFEEEKFGRVVFLGGSITTMKGWRGLVGEDLQRRFPDTRFEFINAGIPSTGSTPGAFRLGRDVFSRGRVDLLFQEAAVNDSTNGRSDTEQLRAMEGIVRHARTHNPDIDLVFLYFVDPDKMETYNQGGVPAVIRNHERVATFYEVPSVDLAREVTERIGRGEFTWKDDFKNLHPAPFGHRLYADSIARMLDSSWTGPLRGKPAPVRSLASKMDTYCYDAGRLLAPHRAQSLTGFSLDLRWEDSGGAGTRPGFFRVPILTGTTPGSQFELPFAGTAIGLFVAAGPDAGIIAFRIDDRPWETTDLFTPWSRRLHIPWLYVLAADLDPDKPHRIRVQIASAKNEASEGHACRIVHFAVNGPDPGE